jgi:hypothetical protein
MVPLVTVLGLAFVLADAGLGLFMLALLFGCWP